MGHKINTSKKALLSICICVLVLSLFFAAFFLLAGKPLLKSAEDFEAYRQQLSELNENYDGENRIIVFSDRKIEDYNCIASASGYGDMYVFQYANSSQAKDAVAYYNSLSYIKSAMMDSIVNTQEDTTDGDFDTVVLDHLSWGAEILGVDSYRKAIEQKYGTKEIPDVYVAVLDTGIDTDNEFLEDRIAFDLGKSFYNSQHYWSGKSKYTFEDDHMHGTHVSGTIVDLTPDNVKIIPVKVLNSDGNGSVSDIMSGIQYIMSLKEQGYNIVAMNMSLAADSTGNESTAYFDEAYKNNIMSVVAAGNESYYAEEYFPANCRSALTVSALSQNVIYENFPFVSYYSNYGSNIDLCLPGTNVLSCVPDDYSYSNDYVISTTGGIYAYLSGTSMATPHASALVALYATYMGEDFTAEKAERALKNNAYDLGDTGRDDLFGYGVPSMDMALTDTELSAEPTLSYGAVGSSYHFEDSISVSIKNNNPAYNGKTYKIYYTLDGSYPTVCGSNYSEYDRAITLTESTHLSFVIYLFDDDGFVKGHSALYEVEYFKGETQDKNTNGTGFEINDNGILTRYTSGLQDVVIPETVNGIKVRELGNNLFFGLNIRSIVCQADVSLYNAYSQNLTYPIRYCPNLKSVTLGSSKAEYAVSHCFGLKELILTNAEAISDAPFMSFSLGYSYLGSYTAYGCSSLERIVALKAKSVGNYAFCYLTTLKELDLPEVTQIYNNTFEECTSLTEVELPKIKNIRSFAFAYCTNLQTVITPVLDYIDEYAFAYCTNLTYIESGTATYFGSYSFLKCTGLKTLDTHSAKKIKDRAFQECENLDWLDFSSVTEIGEDTMLMCYSLRTIYLGSNSYMIYSKKGFWYYRYGNLQYLVLDFSYSGLKSNIFSSEFYLNRAVDGKYRIYTKTPLYTVTYQYESGEEIAKSYHVNSDALTPPDGIFNEEYTINFLSWRRASTDEIFNRGDEVFLNKDETFILVDYNTYYSAYAEQAKREYAALYQKITGELPVEGEVEEIYSAIEQACTVVPATDSSTMLQNLNKIIGEALCDLLDEIVLEHNSDGMLQTIATSKQNILEACNSNSEIVNLDEDIDAVLAAIDEQRQADRMVARQSIVDRTSDLYKGLSAERKSVADELYHKYESRIDAAKYSEYESIINECRIEFIILTAIWDIDDYVNGSEDVQVIEIANNAKADMQSLADSSMSEQELQAELNGIAEQAKAAIEEYLSSQDDHEEPDDPDNTEKPDDPEEPDGDSDNIPNGPDDNPDNTPEESDDNSGNLPAAPSENDGGANNMQTALIVILSVLAVAAVVGVSIFVIGKKRKK